MSELFVASPILFSTSPGPFSASPRSFSAAPGPGPFSASPILFPASPGSFSAPRNVLRLPRIILVVRIIYFYFVQDAFYFTLRSPGKNAGLHPPGLEPATSGPKFAMRYFYFK